MISDEAELAKQIMELRIPVPKLGQPFNIRLIPGIYNLDEDFQLGDLVPTKSNYKMESDEIFIFRDESAQALRSELESFWQSGVRFQNAGLMHKRGIILAGPPASGKSSLLKIEMKKLAEEKGQVVFYSKSPYRLQSTLHQFRKKEPNRPLTVVIEDIDEVTSSYGEYQFLQLLDGPESINHVCYIATTNNLERLSEKLRRPGRFDRKIMVPNPNSDLRKVYLEKKFGKNIPRSKINEIVSLTEGLSFGHLREIVVTHFGYQTPLNETVARVRKDVLLETNSNKEYSGEVAPF